jgi:hypothetical protein
MFSDELQCPALSSDIAVMSGYEASMRVNATLLSGMNLL